MSERRTGALVVARALVALVALAGLAACGSRADRSELSAAAEEQEGATDGGGEQGGGGGGGGEGGGGETTTTQDPAEVEEQVTEVIESGINGANLPRALEPENLNKVQNSDDPRIRATLESIQTNPTFATVETQVKGVEPLDDTGCEGAGVEPPCASVTFDILLNGAVALPDYRGYVVQEDGDWKLSEASLCGLVSLDPNITQCQ
jgi:hypothetical protein